MTIAKTTLSFNVKHWVYQQIAELERTISFNHFFVKGFCVPFRVVPYSGIETLLDKPTDRDGRHFDLQVSYMYFKLYVNRSN